MARAPGDVGEARWPMAGAVLAAIVLTILLPDRRSARAEMVAPADRRVLLVVVVAATPQNQSSLARAPDGLDRARLRPRPGNPMVDRPTDRRPHPRRTGDELGERSARRRNGRVVLQHHRLRAAVLGAGRRRRGDPRPRACRARGLWLPTAARTRGSPTPLATPLRRLPLSRLHERDRVQPDRVMPLAPWAKITMAIQSFISIAILGLVIARAVNLFT